MATEESVKLVIRASRPNFRNNHDKLAFAVHASFLASGFVLISTGPPAFEENALSSSSEEVGIDRWNEVDDEYAFVYKNPKKSNKKVLVKCLVMGDKLMVDALSDGASQPVHLEINVDDYAVETTSSDYDAQFKNLGKLVSSLESNVLSKLDGSSAGGLASGTSRSSMEEPSRNVGGFDTSQEPHGGYVVPPVRPFGGSDLYPGPGAGMYPSRGDFGGGSMLIGPEDPRWFGGGGFPDIAGGQGGRGVPPGARFDPYGPPGVPGFEPDGRFPQGPFSGRGARPPGRIHPDLEQPGSGGFDFI
ncbi:putative proteasome inhibitor [Bienertia sinuspersici]